MSETPHNDALQTATEQIVAAFQLPPSEERTQAILAAYLEHDRARANALAGSLNHLAILFEQTTNGIASYKDAQIEKLDRSMRRVTRDVRGIGQEVTDALKAIADRMHDANNKAMAQLELLYEQSEYASQLDERLTAVEQQQQQLAEEQARIRRELADIRQQLAVGEA